MFLKGMSNMSGFSQQWGTSDGCCTCIQNKGSMMHTTNGACKICKVYLWNRKSGEFELQIVLKHPKFSPFWDKTNVHHNNQLGQVVKENKQSPPPPQSLKKHRSEARKCYSKKKDFRIAPFTTSLSKSRSNVRAPTEKIQHISISDILYSRRN